jgi:hypothetical protein
VSSWRPALLVAGIAIALGGLAAGIYFNQSIIAIVAVLVAVFTALSPTVVPTLSDEIQANNLRYERHKVYFADAILPEAGSMIVLDSHAVRRLNPEAIAWKIGGGTDSNPFRPGRGEDRIPAYGEVMLPHLEGTIRDHVWRSFSDTWATTRQQVATYTEARRALDAAFFEKMDSLVKSRVGPEFEADWSDVRAASNFDNQRRYQAAAVRDNCEYWFQGRYGLPGWTWQPAAVGSGNAVAGVGWAITQSNGSLPYLWGGATPEDQQALAESMNGILDALRFDETLKALFLKAEATHEEAKTAVAPLKNAAEDASHLLRHGPDIPGECSYCKEWKPRF